MRAAVDTNVILYAEGFGDERRTRRADEVLYHVTSLGGDLPAQVCGEAVFAMTRKYRLSRAEAVGRVEAWTALLPVRSLSPDGLLSALALVRSHSLQVFDAMILATVAEAGCQLLLSEDMQDGFVWQGVTVVDPFAPEPHNLLKSYLTMSA